MPYILPSWVSETCILTGWIVAMTFATLYTLKARWWESQMGRNLFGFDLAVAMALTPGFVKYVFDANITGEFYQWFVVADLVLVSVLVAHRGYLLLHVQPGWNWSARQLAGRGRNLYARLHGRGKRGDPPVGEPAAVPADKPGAGSSSA